MAWDYAAENARLNAENERRQEAMRAERLQREMLDLERRRTWAAERQANDHRGVLDLLLFGLFVVGLLWAVMWLIGVIGRVGGRYKNSPHTPNDPGEQDLLDLMRRHNIDPEVVRRAIETTLRKHG